MVALDGFPINSRPCEEPWKGLRETMCPPVLGNQHVERCLSFRAFGGFHKTFVVTPPLLHSLLVFERPFMKPRQCHRS